LTIKIPDKKKLLIYILIEHKSFLDRWVLFQLLGYIVRLSEREREIKALERKNKRQENIKKDLPENEGIEKECITVVLPVILYHGTKDWTIDKKLSALYCNGNNYIDYIPEFKYELIDLTSYENHQIIGNVYLQVAILVMKHYYSDEFDEFLSQILSLLSDLVDDWSTINFISIVLLYSSSHKSRGQQWLSSTIENNFNQAFGKKGGNVMEAVSNIWIEQGKKEKAREMVIEALKIKYNNVTQSISSIVQSIKDEEMLHNLHREVILCNNMSEFQHRLEKIRCSG